MRWETPGAAGVMAPGGQAQSSGLRALSSCASRPGSQCHSHPCDRWGTEARLGTGAALSRRRPTDVTPSVRPRRQPGAQLPFPPPGAHGATHAGFTLSRVAAFNAEPARRSATERTQCVPADRQANPGDSVTCGVVVCHSAALDAHFHQCLQALWLPVPHADAHGFGGGPEP